MAMTAADFLAVDAQAPAKVPRDRYGRPGIRPVDGGELVYYTRASTVGKALDDTEALTQWKLRMSCIGLASRKDLIFAANAHRNDRDMMTDIVSQAMDAAESNAAATSGTALHDALHALDEGREVRVPDDYLPDLDAYRQAMQGLEVVDAEVFVVNDELQVAGTYDRLVRLKNPVVAPDGQLLPAGTLISADIKTGKSIAHGHTAWSCQVSIYSRSVPYDIETETRRDVAPAHGGWGLVIHVPVLKGTATLYWIDLNRGWEFAKLAMTVRQVRKAKTMRPANLTPTWTEIADAAGSLAELRAVWSSAADAGALDADLKAHLTARSKELAA
jgi:hypothetical protein